MLNNKTYEILKWVTMIALPALAVFINSVGTQLGISDPETVVNLINAITVFMGSLIGLSTLNYNKEKDGK